jgi:8-oxo-dGTP pyrophosphatase MutT (NUDIX family)
MTETPLPQKASTIILLRPEDGGKIEVFMTRRPEGMRFLGGFYVFPGGSVEADDWSADTLGRCRGLSPSEAQNILGNELSPELSLAHWVAAIRELFEETGILLCVTVNGSPLEAARDDLRKRLAKKREAVAKGGPGL